MERLIERRNEMQKRDWSINLQVKGGEEEERGDAELLVVLLPGDLQRGDP